MQLDSSKNSGDNGDELVHVVYRPVREYRNPGGHRYEENTHLFTASTPQTSWGLTKNYR